MEKTFKELDELVPVSDPTVTKQLAEWIVAARYEDVPASGVDRVKERFLDSIGTQFAGMTVPTGRVMADWVQSQGGAPQSSVVGRGFKTSASLAALANATAGHALDFDDSSTFSSHPSNPLTSAIMALGDKLGSSGRLAVLAFIVGWEVICQTNMPCQTPTGHTLLDRAWHNQGFQPAFGAAAAASKLMGLDVDQTRMALGHAASTMSGMHKNCGSDTKPFHAGNPPMHGIMAAELVQAGFTANLDIFDGFRGAAFLMSHETQGPESILDGLGTWDLARNTGMLKIYACNGGSHWSQQALHNLMNRRPIAIDEIESIDVYIHEFLMSELPFHLPQTALEAKFSVEYALATIAVDRRAGIRQFTDEMVQRPEAQALMKRINVVETFGQLKPLIGHVAVNLRNGERLEEKAETVPGKPESPLTKAEITEKFHDCSSDLADEARRDQIADMVWNLESLGSLTDLGDAVR